MSKTDRQKKSNMQEETKKTSYRILAKQPLSFDVGSDSKIKDVSIQGVACRIAIRPSRDHGNAQDEWMARPRASRTEGAPPCRLAGHETDPLNCTHLSNRSRPQLYAMHEGFIADILRNRHNGIILDRWGELALPDGWLVAGCLFQTLWNLQAGRAPEADIKDYDLFYFDSNDPSEAAERRVQARVDDVLADLDIAVEVSNQARVHVWYESYFGHPYEQLRTACDGIDRFLVLATCVGIRPGELYAPNGLALLYDGLLTTNPLTPYRNLFDQKAASYRARWPWLRIQSPEEGRGLTSLSPDV
jgi:uncharacterized protein